jgi:Tat protein secretion system quality control protein TatD with DNase activity
LAPVPGQRNEPSSLTVSIQAIAQIKGLPVEAAVEAVAENAQLLYGHGQG